MQDSKFCVAFFILGSVLVGNVLTATNTSDTPMTAVSTTMSTAMAPATLAAVFESLPDSIKTILMKYQNQTTAIDYAAFLKELKADNEYMMLEDNLGMGALTKENLQMLFEAYVKKDNPENSGMRSGVTIGSVVMVTVMTMLMPFLN